MKLLSTIGIALLLTIPAMAQDVHEGNVRFRKQDRTGVIAEYDAPRDMARDALEAKLKTANLGKQHSEGGFWKYEGVVWPEISPNKVDVYFNIEKHKGKAMVSMMVSPGNGNFVTPASDPQIIEGMKAFLTRFNDDIISWKQQVALNIQQKQVDEANHDLERANRDNDRAAKRQKKADRERDRREKDAAKEQNKLDQLKGSN